MTSATQHATVVDSGGRKFVRLDEGPSMGFRASDSTRHAHAIQYVSQPAYPWDRLRSQRSGQYEKPVLPEPDPNAWVHLKVVVRGNDVSAFVNASASPALHVQGLSGRTRGGVGLWVGDPSPGDFANLVVRQRAK